MRIAFFNFTFFSLLILTIVFAICCGNDPKPDVKNRVPTMQAEQEQQLQQLQQQQQQLQEQLQKQQQQLKERPSKFEDLKEGRPEHTNMGVVTEVATIHQTTEYVEGWYLGFTFQEDGGFLKRFFPVCGGQTVPVNKSVMVMYHWQAYSGQGYNTAGCYVIDGYQTR